MYVLRYYILRLTLIQLFQNIYIFNIKIIRICMSEREREYDLKYFYKIVKKQF